MRTWTLLGAAFLAGTTACGSGGGGGGSLRPDLGEGASLHGVRPFPDDNPWNTPVDGDPVDPMSDTLIDGIGRALPLHPDFGADFGGGPFGIPYLVVSGTEPLVPVTFGTWASESDPGPYPAPIDAPVEGGPLSTDDRHVLVIDRDAWMLYEMFSAYPPPPGPGWAAESGAKFDLSSNALRTAGSTSADAAGLPIFPGLVRYDEVVEQGAIRHALRFTVMNTRKGYVSPARHFASVYTGTDRPPMGMRVRLKASFDVSAFPAMARVVLQALKTYGMFVSDNGGNWFVSGAPDARWDDSDLGTLKTVTGDAFEVVQMGPVTTS